MFTPPVQVVAASAAVVVATVSSPAPSAPAVSSPAMPRPVLRTFFTFRSPWGGVG
ncbi:hypothetical protein SGLAM104S_08967 [Streptomyces glaucescens]